MNICYKERFNSITKPWNYIVCQFFKFYIRDNLINSILFCMSFVMYYDF